ncbi:phage tail domain-containing protein [Planobispora siamensis]|uniref:Siphovirus-type tail component C-terminal domain-containing protein n=1 Tax=Planobispora siamensis TaxID=936338 RepID=A0A8J3WQ47_9ACTN|nr:phage tail domain-containing protein [Planobispora siamensis]GIH95446.1 hypothetical protein Psi01_60760 [Planobispora siamensis]
MSTPIDSPVYTLGTWQGNVVDDFGVEWVVEVEDGWSSSPPVKATIEEKTAGDGAWTGPGFYAARVINLTGKAQAPDRISMLEAKDRIKAALKPRVPIQLLVAEAHRTRTAQVRMSDRVELTDVSAHIFSWGMTITAGDPRRYDPTTTTVSTALPAATTTGRTYPKTYPVLYGGVVEGGTGSVFFLNEGDFDETPATITFNGPVQTPRVEHVQTGRNLTFDLTLDVGDVLVVDLLRQTALLNGTSNRAYTISAGSAWFMATPGLNEFAFRGVALPPTEPLMTVTAASAWT